MLDALDKQDDFQFKAMITTLLLTGMRGGELLGLPWKNVDLDKGVIYVRYTLAYIRGMEASNKHVLQPTKTAGSERYIVIPASLVDVLKEHKRRQEERRAVFKEWPHPEMVFSTPTGDYFYIGYLNTKLKQLAKNIGLPEDVHLHSLRHTTASLLINSDIPAKVISEQLGHASTQITQDVYSHIFASSKVKAMQALELKLGCADKKSE